MPRICTVCHRPDRTEIDRALVTGESKRGIARCRGIGPDALERHARAHLPAAILKAQVVEDAVNGDALIRELQGLHRRTLAVLSASERKGDTRGALAAIHQGRENVSLLSRISFEARRVAEERVGSPATVVEMVRACGEYKAEQRKAEAAASQLPPHEPEQAREGPGVDEPREG